MDAPSPSSEHDQAAREQAETWAAHLSHWTSFARAAVALPKDAQGERWRASVPAIIGLQAITMALGELDALAVRGGAAEYAVGVDRASITIREHATALNAAWRDEVMPAGVIELMEDARVALEAARITGVEFRAGTEVIAKDPTTIARELLTLGFKGDLFALPPGTRVPAGTPIAFIQQPGGSPASRELLDTLQRWSPHGSLARRGIMRQVYRSAIAGHAPADMTVPMNQTPPAGRPLLVAVIEAGRSVPRSEAAH